MNESGMCLCGCGGKAPLAKQTNRRHGHVAGKPVFYIHGHHGRGKAMPEHVKEILRAVPRPSGEDHWSYGKSPSKETRQKISKANSGPNHYRWSGGRRETQAGYLIVFAGKEYPNTWKSGYMLEHRYVMAEHLGRPLESHELVHHKNGDKKDNRLENLELMSFASHTKRRQSKITQVAVSHLTAEGNTPEEIANELEISISTVRSYLQNEAQ